MQAKKVVEPFGEVNCYTTTRNTWRVTATILMEPRRQGAQTGIALDGSSSMCMAYGYGNTPVNVVSPVAKRITSYLAGKLDADGGTTFIYWGLDLGSSFSPASVIGCCCNRVSSTA